MSWIKKGAWAVTDQGLISSSNFLVNILLARSLVPRQYGAFALSLECFLLGYVAYHALILEPLCVFGPSVFSDQQEEYLKVLLRLHLAASVIFAVMFMGAGWVSYELAPKSGLAWALVGAAVAGPCVMLFRLVRRALYVKLAPRAAVSGSLVYGAVVVGGLLISYKLGWISPFVAFLLMAVGGVAAGFLLLIKLKVFRPGRAPRLALMQVVRKHWTYGRWALAASLAAAVPGAVYYPLLGAFRGLAETGTLKALLNFSSPAGQFFTALFMLFLPYAAWSYQDRGAASVERLAWRLTWLYAGMASAYWVVFLLFKEPIMNFLYAGKYLEAAGLMPWIALGAILQVASTAQATGLRAIQSPALLCLAFCLAGGSGIVVGVPAIWLFGLRGAIFAVVLTSGVSLLFTSILLRRACRRSGELSKA